MLLAFLSLSLSFSFSQIEDYTGNDNMGTLCRGQNGHWFPPVNCKRVGGRPYAVFSKDTAEGNTGEPCRVPANIFEANVGVDLHVCESSVFEAECPEGSFIAIQDASYGRKIDGSVATRQSRTAHVNEQICPGRVQAGHAGNCHLENSKDIVAAECDGKRACNIVAANDVFGADPCAGTFKLLTVRYQCDAKPITPAEMCESINANDFSSFEVMQQVGWNTEGVVNHQHVGIGTNTDNGAMCNTGSSWWGWANYEAVGQLNVIAPMTTTARIDVGNCWNEGVVKVYVAGVQVLAAEVGEGSKVISFPVTAGDEISIRDEGENSVMRLNSLQFEVPSPPTKFADGICSGTDGEYSKRALQSTNNDAGAWYTHAGLATGICSIRSVEKCAKICADVEGCNYFSMSLTQSCYACFVHKTCANPSTAIGYGYTVYGEAGPTKPV